MTDKKELKSMLKTALVKCHKTYIMVTLVSANVAV